MNTPSFDETFRTRRPRRAERILFDVPTARRMLPLVRQLLTEIAEVKSQVTHRALEVNRLKASAEKDWSAKKSLYLTEDLVAASEASLAGTCEELTRLGAKLLDAANGIAGFPTIVNGSLAYLVFRLEDPTIRYWRYRDEPKLRTVPESWFDDHAVPEECEGLLA